MVWIVSSSGDCFTERWLLSDDRWVPVIAEPFDAHFVWHLDESTGFFLPGKDTNLPPSAAVWGLAVVLSCLNMVYRLVSRSWKISFMSTGHLGHFSGYVCEHVHGFHFLSFTSFSLSPSFFLLNSSEILKENKWKDSALKMDLFQQPPPPTQIWPPPPSTCAGLTKEYTSLRRTRVWGSGKGGK